MGFGSNPLGQTIPRGGTGLSGLDELRRTLNTTKDKIVRRASKAGINAGLVPLVRAMRAAINAAPAAPHAKREARKKLHRDYRIDARKTLAKRLQKKGGETIGKAGFGVGKQTKAKLAKAASGVGISSSNVHWFVLGTKERDLSEKTKGRGRSARQVKTGHAKHPTGKIDPLLKGVTTMAAGTAGPAMVEAARRKIQEVMAREVAKIAKKGK